MKWKNVQNLSANKYRNRRKRFGLRFNLISEIYNEEV
ncbi:MAG: Transposase [candidate division TM6 bacterium GW2011_GWE2_31_21]|nr:MAG: Transposase [candidate division TM6 bacterium GW2011_GWE2_31_21]KKP53958.1 MAG: Transposase [candidate division TM6 bacterium GW2011_GWF2_33_332]